MRTTLTTQCSVKGQCQLTRTDHEVTPNQTKQGTDSPERQTGVTDLLPTRTLSSPVIIWGCHFVVTRFQTSYILGLPFHCNQIPDQLHFGGCHFTVIRLQTSYTVGQPFHCNQITD